MKIANDMMVKIHYTLTGDDGETFDTSRGGEPLEYLHGHGNLIVGLETTLAGKEAGESFNVDVEPADGYGEYDERLVVEVPRAQFDSDTPIQLGMKFQADTLAGPMVVTVTKITDETITVDGNHELAGKTLHFAVEVVEVREATHEELLPQLSGCGGGCSSCGCGGSCGDQYEDDSCGCGCGGGCCH